MKKIFSIVIPVYQNEANLSDTVPKLLELRSRIPSDYKLELIFVDDGSTDQSLEVIQRYAEENLDVVRIVKLTKNFGQTPAIQAGLRHASGHCVGIISADLQEPHEVFIDMLEEWERGSKFIIGERQDREEGWWHQKISGIYWKCIRKFAFSEFPKLGYDFCLLDRQIVKDINHINEKNSSIFVLIYWLGYHPTIIPIKRELRKKGRSQWKLWKKISFTFDTLIGFTTLPARFITSMGMVTGLLCLGYFTVMLIYWLSTRMAPPGWMTVVGLLSLLGSMMLFSVGIVSEYLLRILDEARKRPLYVVDRVIEKTTAEEKGDVIRIRTLN